MEKNFLLGVPGASLTLTQPHVLLMSLCWLTSCSGLVLAGPSGAKGRLTSLMDLSVFLLCPMCAHWCYLHHRIMAAVRDGYIVVLRTPLSLCMSQLCALLSSEPVLENLFLVA